MSYYYNSIHIKKPSIMCKHLVTDRSTGRIRNCRQRSNNNDYCYKHQPIIQNNNAKVQQKDAFLEDFVQHFQEDFNVGKCCFCNNDCNPMSQSCGRCARQVTGYALGWNNNPPQFYYG